MEVRTLCLAVLSFGAASGYEIKKQFETGPIGMFHAVSFGSIYPALTRLESEGLIDGEAHEQEGRPDKKTYRLTASGRAALSDALFGEPAQDRVRSDMAFMLFFAHLTPSDHIEQRLDDYLAWHRRMIDKMGAWDIGEDTAPGQTFIHGLGLAIYRAKLAYIEQNRDRLLAGLRSREAIPEMAAND